MFQGNSITDLFVFQSYHEKLGRVFLNSKKIELSFIKLFEFMFTANSDILGKNIGSHSWNSFVDVHRSLQI